MRRRQIALVAFVTSSVVHGIAAVSLELLPTSSKREPKAPVVAFEAADLALGTLGTLPRSPDRTSPPVLAGGAKSRAALDRSGAQAHGGDGASPDEGILLFSFESTVTLTDTELNNFDKSQSHRLRTTNERASLEQRRATPHPTDAAFLASGKGSHAERRKPSTHETARGTIAGGLAPKSEPQALAPATRPGGAQPEVVPPKPVDRKPMRGILAGRGQRASAKAAVASARPNVDRGPAATTAPITDERVRDDVDAELLAARIERSFVEASVQRATHTAPGAGGAQGEHTGFGNSDHGEGSQALPYLPGAGSEGALDTSDARYVRWFMELRARVQSVLVFPQERALAMDQGTTVYRVVVGRDGRIRSAPTLIRSSGFADLDKAAISAILEVAPFAPLPLELLPTEREVAILMPIQFWNPMVR